MKKTLCIIMALCLCLLMATGCTTTKSASIESTVTEDTKYGAATISLSQEEFEAAGFALGDSVNVVFGNGYAVEDVPYYNGYYCKNGDPVIVAYPGYDNISITFNNEGIWEAAGLTDGDTITITLNEAKKFSDIQDSLGQVYSFVRDDYDSDEEFCNFRALTGGNLKTNFLYRGASPVDNSRGRAAYTDKLLEQAGVNFILDLADSEENIADYEADESFNSPYAAALIKNGNAALLAMSSSYNSQAYQEKLASGLIEMMKHDGPVYIHCMEGKDRTGFVCYLLEALAGASYDELKADYMTTYANYYDVTADGTPEKYEAIADLYFEPFIDSTKTEDDTSEDCVKAAENYLQIAGMTNKQIKQLKAYICK